MNAELLAKRVFWIDTIAGLERGFIISDTRNSRIPLEVGLRVKNNRQAKQKSEKKSIPSDVIEKPAILNADAMRRIKINIKNCASLRIRIKVFSKIARTKSDIPTDVHIIRDRPGPSWTK